MGIRVLQGIPDKLATECITLSYFAFIFVNLFIHLLILLQAATHDELYTAEEIA